VVHKDHFINWLYNKFKGCDRGLTYKMKLRGQGVSEPSCPYDSNFEMIVSAVIIVHIKIKLPHSLTFCNLDQHCQLRQILNPSKEFKSHLTVVCTWCMSDVHFTAML